VINERSIGLYPDVEASVLLDVETLRPGMMVDDVIPDPLVANLLVGRLRVCQPRPLPLQCYLDFPFYKGHPRKSGKVDILLFRSTDRGEAMKHFQVVEAK
jgi:hypothetical protein